MRKKNIGWSKMMFNVQFVGRAYNHILDVIVNYASFMQKLDSRKEKAKPFASFGLVDFHWDECGKESPIRRVVNYTCSDLC